ncbi:MAG: hypothetical protein ACYTGP_08645 [Planctomycetota bacterium]|jgi:hypothetical protein
MTRATSLLLFGCLVALLGSAGGCQSRPALTAFHRLDVTADPAASGAAPGLDREAFRALEAALRPGDIIMGARTDPTSALMRLSMDDYSYYTHSGIVDVRGGDVVVSHATGRFRLMRRSPRLLGKVSGKICAVDLETFIREYHDIRIVRLPDPALNRRLAALTRQCEAEGLPFDPFFDTLDPAAMHCSEYTLRATRSAGYGGRLELARRTPNRSMAKLLRDLGVETEHFVSVDRFAGIPGATIVAEISLFERMETRMALAGAFRVLHERITAEPDAHVGDLVACSAERLMHFTPPTDAYLRGAIGLAEASPARDPREVREHSDLLYDVIYGEPVRAATVTETHAP